MTNNCLVTKLKSVVDNDNLKRLGVIRLKVSGNTFPTGTAKILDINATVVGTDIPLITPFIGGPVKVVVPEGDYNGYIDFDKYSFVGIGSVPFPFGVNGMDAEDLLYSENLISIGWIKYGQKAMLKWNGTLSDFAKTKAKKIRLEGGLFGGVEIGENISGDISAFADRNDIEVLMLCNINKTITGRWENLFASMCDIRTSGSLIFNGKFSRGVAFFNKDVTSSAVFPNHNEDAGLYVLFTPNGCTICRDAEGTDIMYTYTKSTRTWEENT